MTCHSHGKVICQMNRWHQGAGEVIDIRVHFGGGGGGGSGTPSRLHTESKAAGTGYIHY